MKKSKLLISSTPYADIPCVLGINKWQGGGSRCRKNSEGKKETTVFELDMIYEPFNNVWLKAWLCSYQNPAQCESYLVYVGFHETHSLWVSVLALCYTPEPSSIASSYLASNRILSFSLTLLDYWWLEDSKLRKWSPVVIVVAWMSPVFTPQPCDAKEKNVVFIRVLEWGNGKCKWMRSVEYKVILNMSSAHKLHLHNFFMLSKFMKCIVNMVENLSHVQ